MTTSITIPNLTSSPVIENITLPNVPRLTAREAWEKRQTFRTFQVTRRSNKLEARRNHPCAAALCRRGRCIADSPNSPEAIAYLSSPCTLCTASWWNLGGASTNGFHSRAGTNRSFGLRHRRAIVKFVQGSGFSRQTKLLKSPRSARFVLYTDQLQHCSRFLRGRLLQSLVTKRPIHSYERLTR